MFRIVLFCFFVFVVIDSQERKLYFGDFENTFKIGLRSDAYKTDFFQTQCHGKHD